MKIIYQLGKDLFGFVFSGNITEFDATGRFDIDFGIAFTHSKLHGTHAAAHLGIEALRHKLSQSDKDHHRKDKSYQQVGKRGIFLDNLGGELGTGIIEPVNQLRILNHAGLINMSFVFICKNNLIGFNIYRADLLFVDHLHEFAVIHFLHLMFGENRKDDKIQTQDDQKYDQIVEDHRLLGVFDFLHKLFRSFVSKMM